MGSLVKWLISHHICTEAVWDASKRCGQGALVRATDLFRAQGCGDWGLLVQAYPAHRCWLLAALTFATVSLNEIFATFPDNHVIRFHFLFPVEGPSWNACLH